MPKEVDAITKLYDFLLWIIPKLEKFPRSQKFLIADRIETVLLDILDLLIEASYSKKKSKLLRSANLKLEQLRYIRLSKISNSFRSRTTNYAHELVAGERTSGQGTVCTYWIRQPICCLENGILDSTKYVRVKISAISIRNKLKQL